MLSVADVLDILSVPLLGIVPEDQEILRASNIGAPITINGSASPAARAYRDAARRLIGETIPIAVPDEKKKTLFNRLFSRRAA
jgi:septum site-determining protein MinD